ncbi:hypothetical protein EDB85DRAFT_2001583 [Lactarius pseudohatsudake]|nr:hypothetical protein EDB85DRAFT_2001583 [Lactarius pseudohatsudake]
MMSTVGRTSTFSAALTRTIVAILLAGLLPGVKADCSIDWDDFEHCGLGVPARVGLGFGLFFLLVVVISFLRYRWRRAARISLANALQNQRKAGNANNGSDGPPPYAPRYPPQAHGSPGAVPHYAYYPNTGFPPNYAPLPVGPPVEQYRGPYHV